MQKLFSLALLLLVLGCSSPSSAQAPRTTTPQETQQLLAQSGVVLLDVRTPVEFGAGHLKGARNVNFLSTDFPDVVAKLDPNATYVLYCASGNRSGKAAALMQEKGFKNVVNAGGFNSLKEAGLPTE
ncbi:rhodanese-like domain-containing protein [Hymenobacter oligotrophus]|uniref:Rhodanese-like domain-containing protein n=1 Tax=Hymenobacter oligotrophus TaxID=2319843 RepID=A0A3B7QTZ2_9BACT|nr:rhodanese-like domain-containing protein [Hymenobacter oligotrophus]AYA36478.1 rhodanese-like domain-containing protein [Hymenobacter oligotrophus]